MEATLEEFYADFSQTAEDPRFGWRISWVDDDGFCCFTPEESPSGLMFGSKADCELAIEALKKHGFRTYRDMDGIDRNELVQICCSALMW